MEFASIVVDLRSMRCGNCKVALRDELAAECPVCRAVFDRISSNHVGLAARLERRREAAGDTPCTLDQADSETEHPELVSS